jgi:hypothetical protein
MKFASFVEPIRIGEDFTDDKIGKVYPYRTRQQKEHKDYDVVKIEKLENGTVRLTFNQTKQITTFDITPDLFKARTKFMLYPSLHLGFVWVDNDYMNNGVDSYSKIWYHLRARNNVAVNVYFHDSFEDSILFSNYLPITDEEVEVTGGDILVGEYFVNKYPDAKVKILDNVVAKCDALFKINTTDSVVALEQQVDLLTNLVSKLINNETLPSWSSNFLEKVSENSVLTVRDTTSLINDVEKQKKIVREVQKEYFNKRK